MVDSVDKIKKNEYETWYKTVVDNNNGIWLGNGIGDQYVIKTNQRIDEMKIEVPSNFCFVINKGKPYFVKYVEKFEQQTDDVHEESIDEAFDIIE